MNIHEVSTSMNYSHVVVLQTTEEVLRVRGELVKNLKRFLSIIFLIPPRDVLMRLLFTFLTHDFTPTHSTNLFIKSVDDTTVMTETNYKNKVKQLAMWCRDNNLSLSREKTKETIVDFREAHTANLI